MDPAATEFYVDWDGIASDLVAHLGSEAGHNSYDRVLTDLVWELSTRIEEFRRLWAAHNVRVHRTGTKRIHHPIAGEMELSFETMALAADAGLALNVYTAEPGSRSEETLRLLASWTATSYGHHGRGTSASAGAGDSMAAQLFGAAVGDQSGGVDQAAIAGRELGAGPDVAEEDLVGRRAEVL